MKHQYFGDINDYRKYGLLRVLQQETSLRLGVWWMLTPDDGRTDGKFTSYLAERERWRRYDPRLFDELAAAVPNGRTVHAVAERAILADAVFVDSIVPDGRRARAEEYRVALARLSESELVFLDPDNGIEVQSRPPGRKDSSKYVLRDEIADLCSRGKSLVLYQHFRREERSAFVGRIAADLRASTGSRSVGCFQTSNVAFFVVAQDEHDSLVRRAAAKVAATWGDQIRPWFDSAIV